MSGQAFGDFVLQGQPEVEHSAEVIPMPQEPIEVAHSEDEATRIIAANATHIVANIESLRREDRNNRMGGSHGLAA